MMSFTASFVVRPKIWKFWLHLFLQHGNLARREEWRQQMHPEPDQPMPPVPDLLRQQETHQPRQPLLLLLLLQGTCAVRARMNLF